MLSLWTLKPQLTNYLTAQCSCGNLQEVRYKPIQMVCFPRAALSSWWIFLSRSSWAGVVTSCVPAGNQLIPSDFPQGSDQVIWWPIKLPGVLLQLYCYTVNLCCNHFFQYCCNVTCYCTKLINRITVTVMLLLTHATEVLQVFLFLLQSAHCSSIRKGVIYPAVQSVVGVTSLMSLLDVQFWSTKGVVL